MSIITIDATKAAQIKKEKNNFAIISQIETLEAKQHRAIREVILANPDLLQGTAAQKIQEVEAQIAALRAQLK